MHARDHQPSKRRTRSLPALAAGLIAAALLATAPSATAHGSAEHGALTLHDTEDGPDARDLSCEFWVRGTGMSDPDGTLRVAHRLDSRQAHSHRLVTWEGTPDGDGTYSFEVGPLTIHESDDNTGITGFTEELEHKTAGHWVDYRSCDDAPEDGDDGDGDGDDDGGDGDGGLGMDLCAVTVVAAAQGDGSVRVHAGGLTGDAVLERASGDGGDLQEVVRLTPTEHVFVDGETEAGVTYTYRVVVDAEVCASVEVTAIPVFPTPLAGVLAAGTAVVGYAGLRRRP